MFEDSVEEAIKNVLRGGPTDVGGLTLNSRVWAEAKYRNRDDPIGVIWSSIRSLHSQGLVESRDQKLHMR
jgi:hypothetical protein